MSLGNRVREILQISAWVPGSLMSRFVVTIRDITFVNFLSLALTMTSMVLISPRMKDVKKHRGLCSLPFPLTHTFISDGTSRMSRPVSRMQQILFFFLFASCVQQIQNLTESFDCSEIQLNQIRISSPVPPAHQLHQQVAIVGPRIEV